MAPIKPTVIFITTSERFQNGGIVLQQQLEAAFKDKVTFKGVRQVHELPFLMEVDLKAKSTFFIVDRAAKDIASANKLFFEVTTGGNPAFIYDGDFSPESIVNLTKSKMRARGFDISKFDGN